MTEEGPVTVLESTGFSAPPGNILARALRTVRTAGASRYRLIGLAIATSVLHRGVNVVTSIVSVPLTITYLGKEEYGLWMTISSLAQVLTLADVGVGNTVQNLVAKYNAKGQLLKMRETLSTGLAVLAVVALVLSLFAAVAIPRLDLAALYGLRSTAATASAYPATILFAVLFALSLPASLGSKIQTGLQEGFRYNMWQAGASVLTLAAVLAATTWKLGLPGLVALVAAAPLVVHCINSLHFLQAVRPDLKPSASLVSRPLASSMLATGAGFLVVQLHSVLNGFADNLILGQIAGQQTVALYSVIARAFSLPTLLIALVLTPFWPAYADAYHRLDFAWIRRALLRTTAFALLISAASGILLSLYGNLLISFWTKAALNAPARDIRAYALYSLISTSTFSLGYFLLSINYLRFTMYSTLSLLPVSLVLKIYMAHTSGISGLLAAGALCQLVFVTIPLFVFVPLFLKRHQSAQTLPAEA